MVIWLVVLNIFCFHPFLGEMIQFDEHILKRGWFNHQLVLLETPKNHDFSAKKSDSEMFPMGLVYIYTYLPTPYAPRFGIFCRSIYTSPMEHVVSQPTAHEPTPRNDEKNEGCHVLNAILTISIYFVNINM